MSFALGISCERRVFAPVIDNSLKVSSLITAKLLLRRKLHVSDLPKFTLLCSSIMSRFCPWAVTIQKTNHGNMIIDLSSVSGNYLSDWRYKCLRSHVVSQYSCCFWCSWYINHWVPRNLDNETHPHQVDSLSSLTINRYLIKTFDASPTFGYLLCCILTQNRCFLYHKFALGRRNLRCNRSFCLIVLGERWREV